MGTFTLNGGSKAIYLTAGGGSGSANNGAMAIKRNGDLVQTFYANQSANTEANIKVPTFVFDSTTGVLDIIDE